MVFRIETEVTIQARQRDCFAVLMDFQSFAHWNPFIQRIQGTPSVGSTLRVRIERWMWLSPTVTAHEPDRLFEWKGSLGIPGLFDGRHRFEFVPTASGATHFIHSEEFTGALVPLFKPFLGSTATGFAALNQALRDEVLRRVGAQ